jgi:hypothetical protein
MGGEAIDAQMVRDYLHLSRLLDEVEHHHPELSATLRLTLVRSRRLNRAGWLDADRFREVLTELTRDAMHVEAPGDHRLRAPVHLRRPR